MIPSNKISNKDKRGGDAYGYATRMDVEISFNFSTIEDGLLFWMVNSKSHYFGIGIEGGFIKVVSNMIESDNFTTINEWNSYVADGDWHNVKVETDHNSVLISVNGNQVFADITLQPIDVREVDLKNSVQMSDGIFIGKI
jgi:EYS protein